MSESLNEPAASSINEVIALLETDPEYSKTLGINAQGIAYLHGTAGAIESLTNDESSRLQP